MPCSWLSFRSWCRQSCRSYGIRLQRQPLQQPLLRYLLVFALAGLSACVPGRRVVLVPESGALFRVGPESRMRLYFWNGTDWELSQNTLDVPEGWYVGSIDESVNPVMTEPPKGDNSGRN